MSQPYLSFTPTGSQCPLGPWSPSPRIKAAENPLLPMLPPAGQIRPRVLFPDGSSHVRETVERLDHPSLTVPRLGLVIDRIRLDQIHRLRLGHLDGPHADRVPHAAARVLRPLAPRSASQRSIRRHACRLPLVAARRRRLR